MNKNPSACIRLHMDAQEPHLEPVEAYQNQATNRCQQRCLFLAVSARRLWALISIERLLHVTDLSVCDLATAAYLVESLPSSGSDDLLRDLLAVWHAVRDNRLC